MITIIQTMISLYLFHRLFTKKNCRCFKYRVYDTLLVIASFVPAFALFVNVIFPEIISMIIIIISLASIWLLKDYNYDIEKLCNDW